MAATERLQEAVQFILERLDALERAAAGPFPKATPMDITDEMIEAGKAALLACDLDNDESGAIVRSILEAALAKSKGEPDPKAA